MTQKSLCDLLKSLGFILKEGVEGRGSKSLETATQELGAEMRHLCSVEVEYVSSRDLLLG